MPSNRPFHFVFISIILIFICSNSLFGGLYHRPPFKYRYYGKDEKLIDKLDRELRIKLKHIEGCLQIDTRSHAGVWEREELNDSELIGSVNIYLTLTADDFKRMTKGRVPKWAGGVAYPRRNSIVVKTPLYFGQGVPLEVLTAHELTHILVHRIVGDNYLPRWLDEGLAQVLSGESRHGSLARLGRAAISDRLMGLPRVDDVLNFSYPDADLAYAEARSATAWLVAQYGWDAVVKLLNEMGKGTDIEDAFPRVFDVGYEYWQVEWIEYAKKKYSVAVLLDIDSLIWVFILGLGAVAVVAVFIRRRIQFKRWREEEEEEML
ncbi:MAG: peptidase MA family metallohydrolase [Candidatus Hatepunaea meridiana]|nr:peptidase MA family metallohydrolase [Candidatus Hatepunaea meridiana]